MWLYAETWITILQQHKENFGTSTNVDQWCQNIQLYKLTHGLRSRTPCTCNDLLFCFLTPEKCIAIIGRFLLMKMKQACRLAELRDILVDKKNAAGLDTTKHTK